MNKDIKGSLTDLEKSDVYSLMMVLLYASTDNPRYSTLSELAYILDHESFLKFIKYFEGQTITIPDMDTCVDCLRTLMLFQYFKVEGQPWKDALRNAGYDESESMTASRKVNWFVEDIKKNKYRLGGLVSDT